MGFLFLILIGLVLGAIFIYNSLIVSQNRVQEALSDIEVQMKRRYDLIPNLVNTVKGYAIHEKSLLEKITQLRSQALEAKDQKEQIKTDNMLSSTLKTLFAVVENYPDLKANENFLQLQQELVDCEDKIQAARRFYNANVRDYNTKIQIFPSNLIARLIGAKPFEFFDIEEEEKAVPKVEF